MELCDKIKDCHFCLLYFCREFWSGDCYSFCPDPLIVWMRWVYNEVEWLEWFNDEEVHDDLIEIFIGDFILDPVFNEVLSEWCFNLDRPSDDAILYDDTIRRYSYVLVVCSPKKSYAFYVFGCEEFLHDWFDYMSAFHDPWLVLILKRSDTFIDHGIH